MRVLELGSYIVPSYAGMVLAEQGHQVTKWVKPGRDPIFTLRDGGDLWTWLQHGKTVLDRELTVANLEEWCTGPERPDVVIDNVRASTLDRWGIDSAALAERFGLRWVSMRDEAGGRSFDIVAQARATLAHSPYVPWYVGDTGGGLWLAFKAVADTAPGHFVLGQASVLAKLVEGELILDPPRRPDRAAWESETYGLSDDGQSVVVSYRGDVQVEPVRDRAWQRANLWHRDGRIIV